jgi:hypothetical protein
MAVPHNTRGVVISGVFCAVRAEVLLSGQVAVEVFQWRIVECWLLNKLRVAVAQTSGQFGNPEDGHCPPLEAVISRLVKTMTEITSLCDSEL